jgi:hypothetical protein
VEENSFRDTLNITVDGAIANATPRHIHTDCNWFGTTDPNTIQSLVGAFPGEVYIDSYLLYGTDTSLLVRGFQPVPGSCGGLPVHNVTQDTYFNDIISAVNDAATVDGDSITVLAGNYPGNVTVNKSLTLYAIRSIASPPVLIEGNGGRAVTITADGVTLDGFTIMNPDGHYAVHLDGYNNFTLRNNTIDSIGNNTTTSNTHAVVIASESGPADNILIEDNRFSNIKAGDGGTNNGSASAIATGFSTATNPVTHLIIRRNIISDVYASTDPTDGKLAYGISLGAGDGTAGTGTPGVVIQNNEISNLTARWVHAIGMECNTLNAVVTNNKIYDLIDADPNTVNSVALWFETNSCAASVTV